jgi:hypothetical protein
VKRSRPLLFLSFALLMLIAFILVSLRSIRTRSPMAGNVAPPARGIAPQVERRPSFPKALAQFLKRAIARRAIARDALLSKEEEAAIKYHIDAADATLRVIEARAAHPPIVHETDTVRAETVYVPILTTQQLDPIYTQLTMAVSQLPSGKHVATQFREAANAFLRRLGSRPAKLVIRHHSKADGNTTFKLVGMKETTTFEALENGGIRINGTSTISLGTDPRLNEFFPPQPPK